MTDKNVINKGEIKNMAEHSAKGKIARPVKNNIFAKTRNKPLER